MLKPLPDLAHRLRGLLIGTAVGDALGLPAEGLSRQRVARMFRTGYQHRFLFGHGMMSDDTEHTVFVAQSLLRYPFSAEKFATRLGWCLRGWFLSLPAGIGFATLRAIFKLWLGFPPKWRGVYSAGNGPAMRVAVIGAFFAHDAEQRAAYITASTRITHTDPKALIGATVIAELAAWIVRDQLHQPPQRAPFITRLRACGPNDTDWQAIVDTMDEAIANNLSVADVANQCGLSKGVSGYIYHTVPVVAYAWFRHGNDYERALIATIACGGDTDTTGAIIGALSGAMCGDREIPTAWKEGIIDWPRSLTLLQVVADRLACCMETGQSSTPVRYFWTAIPIRNLAFLVIVLLHGFRRLLPF